MHKWDQRIFNGTSLTISVKHVNVTYCQRLYIEPRNKVVIVYFEKLSVNFFTLQSQTKLAALMAEGKKEKPWERNHYNCCQFSPKSTWESGIFPCFFSYLYLSAWDNKPLLQRFIVTWHLIVLLLFWQFIVTAKSIRLAVFTPRMLPDLTFNLSLGLIDSGWLLFKWSVEGGLASASPDLGFLSSITREKSAVWRKTVRMIYTHDGYKRWSFSAGAVRRRKEVRIRVSMCERCSTSFDSSCGTTLDRIFWSRRTSIVNVTKASKPNSPKYAGSDEQTARKRFGVGCLQNARKLFSFPLSAKRNSSLCITHKRAG